MLTGDPKVVWVTTLDGRQLYVNTAQIAYFIESAGSEERTIITLLDGTTIEAADAAWRIAERCNAQGNDA